MCTRLSPEIDSYIVLEALYNSWPSGKRQIRLRACLRRLRNIAVCDGSWVNERIEADDHSFTFVWKRETISEQKKCTFLLALLYCNLIRSDQIGHLYQSAHCFCCYCKSSFLVLLDSKELNKWSQPFPFLINVYLREPSFYWITGKQPLIKKKN